MLFLIGRVGRSIEKVFGSFALRRPLIGRLWNWSSFKLAKSDLPSLHSLLHFVEIVLI